MNEVINKSKHPLRCAIYTRKSHEEGLEQDFNSLDAQREASEAYIQSQQHEGWKLIDTHYDDGGFSGGNIKRPALTNLLEDIKHNKIDIVLVYKVDRLSRSLADFSKLIDLFDQYDVSFVSVTQQFNTSTSMGRLTLNVLLSFAQFEREVTSERIRDKIGASKKKGLWMGGTPPMGYQVIDHKLEVIPDEAKFVQSLFEQYNDLPSLLSLTNKFSQQGVTTKQWISKSGNSRGRKPLSPKYLYRILTNPIYIGKITHKNKMYNGQHDSIIKGSLWEKVQSKIRQQQQNKSTQQKSNFLLKGKLRHYEGYAMSPATFKQPKSERYTRYYVSQKAIKYGYSQCELKTINADQLERIITTILLHQITYKAKKPTSNLFTALSQSDRYSHYRKILTEVVLSPNRISIEINQKELEETKLYLAKKSVGSLSKESSTQDSVPKLLYQPEVDINENTILITLNIQIKRIDGKRYILDNNGQDLIIEASTTPSPQIVTAFGEAYYWRELLESSKHKNAKEMAKSNNVNYMMLLRRLPLTTLAPDIQHQSLSGELPKHISLKLLTQASVLNCWDQQRKFLNLK